MKPLSWIQALPSAGLTRQFKGLIAPFTGRLPQERPIVIVLDALDEGLNKEILNVLLEDVCQLPGVVHLFLTTRDIEGTKLLLQAPPCSPQEISSSWRIGAGGCEIGGTDQLGGDCNDQGFGGLAH